MKATKYSLKAQKTSQVTLPDNFTVEVNLPLLAQAVRVYEDNYHRGYSKTKTRGEVSHSTRKIYRQKGTGLARHGAKTAPIFVGGGKAHGPTMEKKALTLPKKMKTRALDVALSMKASKNKVVLIDGVSDIKKTKEASGLLKLIEKKSKSKASSTLVVLSEKNSDKYIYFRNIRDVMVVQYRNLNPYIVYLHQLVVVDNDTFKVAKKAKSKAAKKIK